MDLKKLERANKIIGILNTLEEEIKEIDKFAQLLIGNGENPRLQLFVDHQRKENPKQALDQDGSLLHPEESRRLYFNTETGMVEAICEPDGRPLEKETQLLNLDLNQSTTLQILGFMLQEKRANKQELLKRLKRLGIQL